MDYQVTIVAHASYKSCTPCAEVAKDKVLLLCATRSAMFIRFIIDSDGLQTNKLLPSIADKYLVHTGIRLAS